MYIVYVGCYQDSWNRILPHTVGDLDNNTAVACADICFLGSYQYAGTEAGSQCYCGNTVIATE